MRWLSLSPSEVNRWSFRVVRHHEASREDDPETVRRQGERPGDFALGHELPGRRLGLASASSTTVTAVARSSVPRNFFAGSFSSVWEVIWPAARKRDALSPSPPCWDATGAKPLGGASRVWPFRTAEPSRGSGSTRGEKGCSTPGPDRPERGAEAFPPGPSARCLCPLPQRGPSTKSRPRGTVESHPAHMHGFPLQRVSRQQAADIRSYLEPLP